MVFLDKIFEVNADDETFEKGYKLNVSGTEIETMINVLEFASEFDVADNPLAHEQHSLIFSIQESLKNELDLTKVEFQLLIHAFEFAIEEYTDKKTRAINEELLRNLVIVQMLADKGIRNARCEDY